MLSQIALMPILGYPAVMYGGLLTLLLIIVQTVIGHRIMTGKCKLPNPRQWHKVLAWIILIFGLGHGLLGLSVIMAF
jgi:cytochrome b561